MKIFSKTHTIFALAAAAVLLPLAASGKPVSKTAVVGHPAGTVLDMDDDEAQSLIAQGVATEYKAEEHEGAPKGQAIIARPAVDTALPEGATQPTVVRQDATINDGPVGAATGAQVLFDTKDAARLDADRLAAATIAANALKSPEQLAADKAAADKAAQDAAEAEEAARRSQGS